MFEMKMQARINVSIGDWVRFLPVIPPDPFWNGESSVALYKNYKGKVAKITGFLPIFSLNGSMGGGGYLDHSFVEVQFQDGRESVLRTDLLEYLGPTNDQQEMTAPKIQDLPEPQKYWEGDAVCFSDDLLKEKRKIFGVHVDENTGVITYRVTATEAEIKQHEKEMENNPDRVLSMPPYPWTSIISYKSDQLTLISRKDGSA